MSVMLLCCMCTKKYLYICEHLMESPGKGNYSEFTQYSRTRYLELAYFELPLISK